jgi:hypothetical protein
MVGLAGHTLSGDLARASVGAAVAMHDGVTDP